MAISVIDLSVNIWKGELQEDSSTSSVSIMYWLRANIGTLNNLLGTCYKINQSTLEPNNDGGCILGTQEASIFKYCYLLNYYERCFKNMVGVNSANIITEATSDGGTLRFLDRGKLGQLYLQLRKDTQATLDKLINRYKYQRGTPQSVEGDDTMVSLNSYTYREQGIPYQDTV